MFSLSDILSLLVSLFKLLKFWNNPFYKVTFSFRIIPLENNINKAELRIYNLSDKIMIVGLRSKNVDIDIPNDEDLEKENWDTSIEDSKNRNLDNSWIILPSYLNNKKYTKIIFHIDSECRPYIKFYDYQYRKSLKIWFKKI